MNRALRVAIAEDEPITREYLQALLEGQGHEVMSAVDGRQLVELCQDFEPDVVVTDLMMPGLDGLEAGAEINRSRPVPVVLLSASMTAESRAAAAGGFVASVLTKPVRPGELSAAVARASEGAGVPR